VTQWHLKEAKKTSYHASPDSKLIHREKHRGSRSTNNHSTKRRGGGVREENGGKDVAGGPDSRTQYVSHEKRGRSEATPSKKGISIHFPGTEGGETGAFP